MAAGLGFKTFTTGEVLTAADTNGYLMQGVLVFASSAARAAAITSPQEGQYSYLKDTNSTEYYDGAAWIAAPIGDITGVTAGTGISGGGTSGTVTITNSMATEITAKGDLIAGTGSATFDNLPVGTNGQTLVADSTAATGLKWATASTAFSGALVTKTSAQAISASTQTTVSWDTEANGFDTNTYHDNTTNNSRLTVPSAGYYRVSGQITLDASASGYRNMNLVKNGSTTIAAYSMGPNSVDWTYIPFTFTVLLAASDYLTLSVFYSGANPNIQGNNTYTAISNFSVQFLGA